MDCTSHPSSREMDMLSWFMEYTPMGERPPVYYKLEKKN